MSDQYENAPQTLVAVDDAARSAAIATAFFYSAANLFRGIDSEVRNGGMPNGGGVNLGMDNYGQVYVRGYAGGTTNQPGVQAQVSMSPLLMILIGYAVYQAMKG